MRIAKPILACIIILNFCLNEASSKSQDSSQNSNPLKYVTITNAPAGILSDPKSCWRYIEVLMDEKSFDENNLKKLYKKLFADNPYPQHLIVSVLTSFDQMRPNGAPQISEQPDNPESKNHHRAAIYRQLDGNEFILMTIKPPSVEMKKIALKESTENTN